MTSKELEYLIQDFFDGSITEEQLSLLQDELRTNPKARDIYRDFVHLQNAIQLQAQAPDPLSQHVIPIDRIIRKQKYRATRTALITAAAVIILVAVTMKLFFVPEKPPTLTFETAPGTLYALSHGAKGKSLDQTMALEIGSRLQLSQGSVELTFGSGVKSIVVAPADITLHDDDTLFMNQGTAWFQVPQEAVGFKVNTNDLEIVDLGTEFGVLARPSDHDEVHVIKGKIAVTAKHLRKESTTLIAGQARRIDPVGKLTRIQPQASAFLTSLPNTLPHLHWSFDKKDKLQAQGTHPAIATIKTSALSAQNAPSYRQGKQGNSIVFNGKQCLVTNWTGFDKNRPRTVSFWLRLPKDASYTRFPGIVGWGDNTFGNSKWKILAAQDRQKGKTYLRLSWGVTWINGSTPLTRDQWHHIAVTSSGQSNDQGLPTAELYIDGKRETIQYKGQTKAFKTPNMNTSVHTRNALPLVIGRALNLNNPSHLNFFNGEIDELYIFDGHMDEEEIQKLIHP